MLTTARLLLRPYHAEDLADLYAYLSDPAVVAFEPYRPMTREEAEAALAARIGNRAFIAVEQRESGVLIGNLYLGEREFESCELGYVFHRAYWGQGFAEEACRALLRDVFESGAHRVYAECDPQNTPSWRLLERLGFAREAHFKQNVYFWKDEGGHPLWKDTYVYALTQEDAI